jgi:A/G-specific adenine glycosylase
LGATLCGPNWAPKCEACPCRGFCGGALHGTAQQYPVKLPKKEKKTEEKTVFILSCDGQYALEKRPETGLLAGLWQFPNVPGKLDTEAALSVLEAKGLHPKDILRKSDRKHIFTHIRWEMDGYWVEVEEPVAEYQWLTAAEIEEQIALPTAFRQFWIDTTEY